MLLTALFATSFFILTIAIPSVFACDFIPLLCFKLLTPALSAPVPTAFAARVVLHAPLGYLCTSRPNLFLSVNGAQRRPGRLVGSFPCAIVALKSCFWSSDHFRSSVFIALRVAGEANFGQAYAQPATDPPSEDTSETLLGVIRTTGQAQMATSELGSGSTRPNLTASLDRIPSFVSVCGRVSLLIRAVEEVFTCTCSASVCNICL